MAILLPAAHAPEWLRGLAAWFDLYFPRDTRPLPDTEKASFLWFGLPSRASQEIQLIILRDYDGPCAICIASLPLPAVAW